MVGGLRAGVDRPCCAVGRGDGRFSFHRRPGSRVEGSTAGKCGGPFKGTPVAVGQGLLEGSCLGALAAVSLAEEPLARHREGADDQDADEPDHDGDEDGDHGQHGALRDEGITQGFVAEDGDRDTPPGQNGVHAGSQQPGGEQVPDFGGFIQALLRGEQAGDAGEVDAAEGQCQDGGPADAGELQITQQVREGKFGGGEVEDLEGAQGGDDDDAESQAAADAQTVKDSW